MPTDLALAAYETHPYLAEAGQNGRQAWLAAIDKIAALNPTARPLDPDNGPSHIDATRQYIRDFNELNNESETALQLYDRMLALYPDRIDLGIGRAPGTDPRTSMANAPPATTRQGTLPALTRGMSPQRAGRAERRRASPAP